jgi:multiple sugar transport system ATP-binding protein
MEQVVLKNVYKKYGEVDAVNNLSFSCKEGEFLAMLGPSGCGKSSTLRMIAGLEEITQGEIYIVNRLVNSLPPGSRNIALAFENYALYPPLTVFENIAFPLQASGMDYTKFRRRVNEVAEILNLTKILKRRPSKLSGGQQQLTSLARALVKPADVYLLDEPISHMDADLRNKMRGELRRIHKEMGATFIYVTHDQLEALSMADRIAIMNFGNLQQIGTVFEIYNHPANLFVAGFIGEPPMNLLEMVLVTKNGMVTCNVDGNLIPITKELKVIMRKNI